MKRMLTLAALVLAVALAAGCAAEATGLYTCPMHPDYISDKPGTCPICGMTLVPLKAEAPKQQAPGHQHQAMPPGAEAAPQGLAPVHTEDERAQLAGVRTVEAVSETLSTTVRAVGNVVPDEARVRHVTSKVGGWVDKLYVNAVGQLVRAGQPLLELYSPELLATQEEYVRALRSAEELSKSSVPEVRRGAEDLASAARRRLELFDVPPDFIEQLRRTGTPQRTIVFRAPFGGYVSDKTVLEGHKIEPGEDLMTLTDLSRVWVSAQLYEAEAAAARVGRPATVTLPYDEATSLRGTVSLVYPTVDPQTRTIQVRLEFANAGLVLKPGMFVNVALERGRASGVVVPDSAVIDSGTRQVVFVEEAPGHFQPREVRVALRGDGHAVLAGGVKAGERVAVAANFLLDSESRLRGAATTGGTTGEAPMPAGHEGHRP